GDVRRVRDSVIVSIRLVDGASNVQLDKADAVGTVEDILEVRSSIIDSVTQFLRLRIGERLAERQRQQVSNREAWETVIRVQQQRVTDLIRTRTLSPADRAARFAAADAELRRAASLDSRWPVPDVHRGRLLMLRATIEESLDGNAGQPGA